MRKSRIVILLAVAALVSTVSTSAYSAAIPDEQFTVQNPPTNDRYTGINLEDTQKNRFTLTELEARTADGTAYNSHLLSRTPCAKVGDTGCEIDKFFQYSTALAYCTSSLTSDCITSVFAKDANGNVVEGKFVESFPGETKYSFTGDPSLNLPPGGSTFIVDFPTLPHPGGTQYLVVANLVGAKQFGQSKFEISDFTAGIFAVSKVSGQFGIAEPETNADIRPDHTVGGREYKGGGSGFYNGVNAIKTPCIQATKTSCLISWPLALNVEFGMTIKLQTKLTGWIHGRVSDIDVAITKASDGDQVISVKGKPSVIPGVAAWYKKSDLPSGLQTQYKSDITVDSQGAGWPSLTGSSFGTDGLPYSILKEQFGYDTGSFNEILAWINAVSDKATFAPTVWSIRSIGSGEIARCASDQQSLSGFVTTNASMYVASPPTYNAAEGTLDYKVIAPHYLPDGTEFKGMYNLVIKSDVARCIYGFSAAPVKATISIVSADGTAQVATTVVGEKDGWLYLSAKNFTFSSPTVKVKLTQDPTTVVRAPEVPAKVIALKATKTITCAKGKSVKKVTGTKPACPSGYKKK